MDAIVYLRQEHSKIRKSFAAISKVKSEKTKVAKFKALCKYLEHHEKMEEKSWYPTLRKDAKLKGIIKHLVSEEKAASKVIKSFKKIEFGIMWKLKFTKFKHDVNHHAKDEEKDLFPKVRKSFTKAELNALGTKMRKFKSKLK
jgi:hemerythrin superfamily protein